MIRTQTPLACNEMLAILVRLSLVGGVLGVGAGDGAADDIDQVVNIDGIAQERERAEIHGLRPRSLRVIGCGVEDHWYRAGSRVFFERAADLEAKHVGKMDVEQDDVGVLAHRQLKRLVTGLGLQDIEAGTREMPAQ